MARGRRPDALRRVLRRARRARTGSRIRSRRCASAQSRTRALRRYVARHRQLQGGACRCAGRRGLPPGRRAGERHSRSQERVLPERRGVPARRSPTRCAPSTGRSSTRAWWCRSTTRAPPSPTTAWSRPRASTTTAAGSRATSKSLNRALEGIPDDRVRYHVCWGSWPGPHTTDVPLRDIVDLILRVRAGALRHRGRQPAPRARVARLGERRSCRRARCSSRASSATRPTSSSIRSSSPSASCASRAWSGRENVIAGTDCGFAQGPFYRRVHPSIMWAKLESLAAGARLATRELWGRN